MMNILVSDFVTGVLIFLRISAMIFTVPVFNNQALPVLGKLAIAILLAYVIFFTVGGIDYNGDINLVVLALMGLKEIVTGILMGLTLNFVFYGLSFAGLLIGRDMGLVMSEMFDLSSDVESNSVGVMITTLATLIFLLINGHHFVVQSLSYSFKVIPLGHYTLNDSLFNLIIKYAASIFIIAIKIASPILVAFFLLHLASGIISRVSPSFQVFFVLLPLQTILGFILLIFVIPIYVYVIKNLLGIYEDNLLEIIKVMNY